MVETMAFQGLLQTFTREIADKFLTPSWKRKKDVPLFASLKKHIFYKRKIKNNFIFRWIFW